MKNNADTLTFKIIPGLEGATLVRSSGPMQTSARHKHESLTLGVVVSGSRLLRFGTTTFEAMPGDVLYIPPAHTHACPSKSDCEYIMFNFPLPLLESLGFTTIFPEPHTPIIDAPSLFGQIVRLADSVDSPAFAMERQSKLIAILTTILDEIPDTDEPPQSTPQHIEKAARHIEIHSCQNIRLEELARIAELSPCRFNRHFSNAFGMPPHEYHNQLRIKEAKQLMARGTSLAKTAAQCGFSDQSHMNRVFKKIMGMTPGKYAKAFS